MAKRDLYYDQAEKLFCESHKTIEQIAEILPVTAKTLYEWKQYGDWDRRKKAYMASRRNVTEILREKLEQKIGTLDGQAMTAADTDEIAKISATIERMERQAYDLKTLAVEVMERFGRYLRSSVQDAGALKEISQHIQGFFEWLEQNG